MVDKVDMVKAGEEFLKQWEKLPEEEREAIEKSINSEENAEWLDQIRAGINAANRFAHNGLTTPHVPIPEGKHPIDFLEEQNELLRKQLASSEMTTRLAIIGLIIALIALIFK
jgi:TRAP-type C4-dicarboxylate transport system substrate-binding protein